MPKNNIHETIDMMTPFEFDDPRKPEYHRLGRRVLKQLARDLDIPEGSYDIRSNKGGLRSREKLRFIANIST